MPPVKRLQAAGVNVFSGSDNIRDAWSPFGNGDLIERAGLICDRQDFRADADLELAFRLVCENAALATGLGASRLAKGESADFLLVEAASIAETVATPQGSRNMGLDPSNHRIYLASGKFGPAPAAGRRGPLLPGSFTLLVIER